MFPKGKLCYRKDSNFDDDSDLESAVWRDFEEGARVASVVSQEKIKTLSPEAHMGLFTGNDCAMSEEVEEVIWLGDLSYLLGLLECLR